MTQYCLRFQLLWNNLKHKHKQTSHALLYLLSRESLGASGTDKNTRRETRDFYFYTVYVWQYNTKNCYKTDFNAKNGRVCVFSDASGEDERGARTAFVTWASWPVTSRTASASWLATLTRVWTVRKWIFSRLWIIWIKWFVHTQNDSTPSKHHRLAAPQIKSNQITFIVTSPQHKCLGEWNS